MTKKLICAATLFVLGACNNFTTFTDNRLVAKYTYDGVTYDVYEATRVYNAGASVSRSAVFIYRLFPEGADPQIDGSTTGFPLGTDRQITTCVGKLAECKIEFGKVLEKNKTAANTEPEGGRMY